MIKQYKTNEEIEAEELVEIEVRPHNEDVVYILNAKRPAGNMEYQYRYAETESEWKTRSSHDYADADFWVDWLPWSGLAEGSFHHGKCVAYIPSEDQTIEFRYQFIEAYRDLLTFRGIAAITVSEGRKQ